ncbi:Protein ALP1-like [Formica fusca]
MSVQQFDYLHDLLIPKLQKRSRREPLSTEIRVAVTLSFLAHGDNVATTSWYFRIGKSTLYNIIPEVCKAIWEVVQPIYLQCPQQENEWIKIADEFYNIWNFPNCIGAIDGKHCRIQAPINSGSAFHNYKGYFSFVLMEIADARYRFIWVDIGNYGSLNDAGIWSNTAMCQGLENNTISLPEARSLPNTNLITPFSFVGDEGFPLKIYLMRPYARRNLVDDEQRIFNYRLSRARRVVENAFGILVSRWRILQKPLNVKLETAELIVQAVTCLHNYIIDTGSNDNQYLHEDIDREGSNGEIIAGNWRNLIRENNFINPLGRVGANIGTVTAMRQRDALARYFISEQGSIPWQWQHI